MNAEPDLFEKLEAGTQTAPDDASLLPFDVALLALGSIHGLGPKGLRSLVRRLEDSVGRLFQMGHNDLAELFATEKIASPEKLAAYIVTDGSKLIEKGTAELRRLQDGKTVVIPPSRLPEHLRAIQPDPPHWLFVQGNASLLNLRPMVAVVGTRDPTEKGRRAAAAVVKVLAPYQITLVSGLAEGIDEEAHRASLNLGIRNVAFLGHGIDMVFPTATAEVRQEIVQNNGAVATEYLPWEKYQKRFFVQRNRLQAGLADLVIPVEAKETGGTSHTVRFAQRFSRPIVAIRWPGANGIFNELEREGCPVVDIFSADGFKKLDRIIRGIVQRSGKDAYPLASAERTLLREAQWRDVRPEDVRRLIRTLEDALKEPLNADPTEGRDLRLQHAPDK